MKKIRNLVLLFWPLSFAAILPAQSPSLTSTVQGNWKGEWSNNIGHYFTFTLELTQDQRGKVEGSFTWTIVESPHDYEQAKLGLTAIEYVRGTFNPRTRKLTLNGYRKDDPHLIIGLDYYTLGLSDNGRILEGPTRNNHTWQGVFYGTRILPKVNHPAAPTKPKLEGRDVITAAEIQTDRASMMLEIWDNSREDGDIVSLNVNGVWVLQEYPVTQQKHVIPITLEEGENRIVLHAENLGRIPPNTAAISLLAGDEVLQIMILNSDMGKSEAIRVWRK